MTDSGNGRPTAAESVAAPAGGTQAPAGEFPFWGYGDLGLMFALALVAGVAVQELRVAELLARGALRHLPGEGNTQAGIALTSQFLAFGIWFTCMWGLFRLRYRRPFWQSLAWVKPPRPLLLYAVYGPALALAVALLGAAMQTPEIEMPMKEMLRDRASLVLVGLFATTLGPLCEELAFRGFVLPLLARSFGPVMGIVTTSLVFALLHGPQYAWSWRHVLLITLAAAAFGLVRLRAGSTLAATVMHATYNLTFFLAYLAQWEDMQF